MISMACEAATKESSRVGRLIDKAEITLAAPKIQKAHARCQGAPGRGHFVCDCICHKPQGGG